MKKLNFRSTEGLIIIAIVGISMAIYLPIAKRLINSEYHYINYIIWGIAAIFLIKGIKTDYDERPK
ncbi:hypothetical protein PQO01_00010 [Lentisphaera marina]|uniref:hypothetical protein n=1 Tax=Lentisphaera marina TaxID=1111041 RepID=UPI002367344A|nr:hypothetical protein [Lentisphaera marina]MDD7983335.1 hypothetical protein [Lentisphaera marina]